MDELAVRQSILNYFDTNFLSTAEYGSPERFDPQAEALDSWAYCLIDSMDTKVERTKRFITFRVVAQCHARVSNNLYTAARLAKSVSTVLRNKTFDCQDYDTSDNPVVGTIRTYEPRLSDETDKLSDEGWQQINVIVTGIAQEA